MIILLHPNLCCFLSLSSWGFVIINLLSFSLHPRCLHPYRFRPPCLYLDCLHPHCPHPHPYCSRHSYPRPSHPPGHPRCHHRRRCSSLHDLYSYQLHSHHLDIQQEGVNRRGSGGKDRAARVGRRGSGSKDRAARVERQGSAGEGQPKRIRQKLLHDERCER